MRIPRIYINAEFSLGTALILPADAARHIGKVLRLPEGAELLLFNGRGGQWRARLAFDKSQAQAIPEQFEALEVESSLQVTLLQGIGRGERMDYAIQKAVELGVSAIQPVFTERTVVKLSGSRLEKRMQHWRGIMVAACEQCGRNTLPQLLPALGLAQALSIQAEAKWLLAPSAQKPLNRSVAPASMALLIGPEGGLSNLEMEQAAAAGWKAWQLGPRVLRTETAASAALAVLQAKWGDFA